MIQQAQAAGATVMLAGMQIPGNYGPIYQQRFAEVYSQLAASDEAIRLIPFLLEGVATEKNLVQADGLHPVAEAQPLILETVWTHLEPLLSEVVTQ